MSAQRRTAAKRDTVAREEPAPNGPAAVAVGAPPGRAPSSRPPKPAVPERAGAEPRSGLAGRLDDLKRSYADTLAELKKVNWPDRETTKNLTIVVIGISVVLGLLLGGIDFLLQTLFNAVP